MSSNNKNNSNIIGVILAIPTAALDPNHNYLHPLLERQQLSHRDETATNNNNNNTEDDTHNSTSSSFVRPPPPLPPHFLPFQKHASLLDRLYSQMKDELTASSDNHNHNNFWLDQIVLVYSKHDTDTHEWCRRQQQQQQQQPMEDHPTSSTTTTTTTTVSCTPPKLQACPIDETEHDWKTRVSSMVLPNTTTNTTTSTRFLVVPSTVIVSTRDLRNLCVSTSTTTITTSGTAPTSCVRLVVDSSIVPTTTTTTTATTTSTKPILSESVKRKHPHAYYPRTMDSIHAMMMISDDSHTTTPLDCPWQSPRSLAELQDSVQSSSSETPVWNIPKSCIPRRNNKPARIRMEWNVTSVYITSSLVSSSQDPTTTTVPFTALLVQDYCYQEIEQHPYMYLYAAIQQSTPTTKNIRSTMMLTTNTNSTTTTIPSNCQLHHCFIFNHVQMGEACKLQNCIVGHHVQLGDHVSLQDCVLGHGVRVPSHTHWKGQSITPDTVSWNDEE